MKRTRHGHLGGVYGFFHPEITCSHEAGCAAVIEYELLGLTNNVLRTLHVPVTAWDIWDTGLWFNCETNKHDTDAINLRHDFATPIDYTRGEWEKPRDHAASPTRNEPACWIAGTRPTVKARFEIRPTDIKSATLTADFDGLILSWIDKTAVVFSNGVTCSTAPHADHAPFLLESAIPTVVSRSTNEVWHWYATALNGHNFAASVFVATNGPRVAYSILGEPVAPWTDANLSNTNVWSTALDFVTKTNACAGAIGNAEALAHLSRFLFSGHGLVYDKDFGESAYTEGTADWMDLTGYMEKSATESVSGTLRAGNIVNCYDQAAALVVLGRIIGVNSEYRIQQPFGYLNTIGIVGIGHCNNPFFGPHPSRCIVGSDDVRTKFGNHAFAVFGGFVFDACGGPEIGTNTVSSYLQDVIDRSTPWESAVAAPTNSIPWTFDFRTIK